MRGGVFSSGGRESKEDMAKRNHIKNTAAESDTAGLADALQRVHREVEKLLAKDHLTVPQSLSVPLELQHAQAHVWQERADLLIESAKKVALHEHARSSGQGLWCFQCRTFGCHHSQPDSPSHIFSGYSATGKPMWEAFIDACIRLKPDGMDALFGEKPIPLAMVLQARDLNEERLPEFVGQKEVPEFCGQVVAGLVPTDLWTHKGNPDRTVLSVQLFKRSIGHTYEYQMNLMGLTKRELLDAAVTGGRRSKADLVSQVIQRTQRRLRGVKGELATLSGSTEMRHEAFVDRVLAQLRSDISQICRSGTLRTKHAEKRHKGGERPTGTAFSDALTAGIEKTLFDVRHKTYVILGRNQRAHVFSPQGRHVTSLRLQKGEIERKLQRHRWRAVSRQEHEKFIQVLDPKRGGRGGSKTNGARKRRTARG